MKITYFYCQSDGGTPEEINQNPVSNSLITHKTFFSPSQSSGFCLFALGSGEGEKSENDKGHCLLN